MSLNKSFLFYVPIGLILLGFYRNSWFPGNVEMLGREIWVILFTSSLYLLLMIDHSKLLNSSFYPFSGYNIIYILLFVLFVFSTVFYNSQEISVLKNLIRLIDYVLYFIIFYLLFPKFLNSNPEFFKKFVFLVAQIGFITSIFGIILFFLGIHPDSKFAGTLVAYIQQPNYVVFILNLGILSALYYYDWQKENLSLFKKYFFIFSIFIQFFATLLTLSRGGYIGIGVGLLVYFTFKFRSKIVLVFPFFAGLAIVILPPFFKAKGFGTFLLRLYLLIPAYYMMTRDRAALFFGYGITNTFDEFVKYNNIYNIGEFHLNNPHNAVVSLILMFGVLFVILLVLFVSLILVRVTLKIFKEKNLMRSLFYSYIICIISMLIFQSIFDSEIVVIEFFSLQFLLIFLGLLSINSRKENISNIAQYVSSL